MSDLKEKNQTLRLLLLSFFLALFSLILLDRLFSHQILSLQKKDSELQESITRLALETQAAETQQKKDQQVMHHDKERLAYQKHTQLFLQALSNGQQKTVCFSELIRHKDQQEWQGYALSSHHLFAYLSNLNKNKAWQSVTLLSLQQEVMQEKVKFKVRLKERVPLVLGEAA